MFSSPLTHYFRHAMLTYHENGKNLRHKLTVRRELNSLEDSLLKLKQEHPNHPKIQTLIERIRSMKARL